MKRSRLRNKYLNNNNEENRKLYDQQRNCCVSLLRKTKKVYYENLDERKVSYNKLFWKTVEPLIWLQKRFYYSAVPLSFARKMEKVYK